jgi:hypothetical protein
VDRVRDRSLIFLRFAARPVAVDVSTLAVDNGPSEYRSQCQMKNIGTGGRGRIAKRYNAARPNLICFLVLDIFREPPVEIAGLLFHRALPRPHPRQGRFVPVV